MKDKVKLKDWKHLIKISREIEVVLENGDIEIQYLVPPGAHGLSTTKITLDADDEIKQLLKYHDDNKFPKAGSIVLVGTEY